MCFMSAPKPPPLPPPPEPLPPEPLPIPPPPPPPKIEADPVKPLPTPLDPAIAQARETNRRAAQQRQGRSSTILTSGLGLTEPAKTAKKTLLGS